MGLTFQPSNHIGQSKLTRYGAAVLDLVRQH
jgi:hypothetical protein